MTKETLDKAKQLELWIRTIKTDIESLEAFSTDDTATISLSNKYHHFSDCLTKFGIEVANMLLERKYIELEKAEKEFKDL